MSASESVEPLALTVEDLRCPCCAEIVLEAVRGLPGVASATLDYQTGRLEAAYDPGLSGPEEMRAAIRGTGYRLSTDPPGATTGQLAHGAQLAPIACGTKLSLIHI